jgi:hypothetical protein
VVHAQVHLPPRLLLSTSDGQVLHRTTSSSSMSGGGGGSRGSSMSQGIAGCAPVCHGPVRCAASWLSSPPRCCRPPLAPTRQGSTLEAATTREPRGRKRIGGGGGAFVWPHHFHPLTQHTPTHTNTQQHTATNSNTPPVQGGMQTGYPPAYLHPGCSRCAVQRPRLWVSQGG